MDFARPNTTKVLKSKRVPSSASSTCSTGSLGRKSGLTLSKSASATGSSTGAVDEDFFVRSFEDVNRVQLFSSRDLTDHLTKCKDTLSDTNIAWEKRVEATLRGIMVAGAMDYDDFNPFLRTLEPCFMNSVKDLRSQVVREACITVGYFSQQLGSRFDHSAETLLPVLINLIPNSAKVMATSGLTCIRFILQYTFASRLIPIITNNLSSKASIIRRSFWGFTTHFKDQGDLLLSHLDPAKQKALQGELSNSSSSNSVNSGQGGASAGASRVPRARSASQDRGHETSTLGRIGKKSHQRFRSARSDTGGDLETFNDRPVGGTSNGITRSSSAVDITSGTSTTPRRRSSSTLLAARLSNGSTNSLPRQKPRYDHIVSSYAQYRASPSIDHSGRNRTRLGTSQSQPNSRSSSPTPRGSYLTHTVGLGAPMTPGRPRKASTLSNPRSTGTSRETSPSRSSVKSSGYGRERRSSGSKAGAGTKTIRTLKPGQDVEELLERQPIRKRYESYDSDDNASETSSVCSERSFSSSYGKTSEDMGEILTLLQSNAYQERKEGVVSLHKLLRQNRFLTRIELKKATEIFTRMFHDPHSKVFSLFLEMLIDLIQVHSRDITDWLYVLLSRLLHKLGADILGSLQAKVQRALDATRENFPSDLQFNILTRFIVDQTQSQSMKVKLAMLNYLSQLVPCMEPADFSNNSDSRLVVSRIITWTNEPKNTDVRKAAQAVLISLFSLNPPEFSMMLSGLPKTFQDGATRILQQHLKGVHEPDVLTPRNTASPQAGQNRSRPPSRGPYGRDEADTENMNPEDIYNSFKKTAAEIQNLSFNSKLDNFDDVKKRKEFTSQDSGIQDLRNDSPDAGDSRHEERKNAMLSLIKLTREGMFELWEDHFKSILLILLETLGDDDMQTRSLALRVLREILRNQSERFKEYAELTVLRILDAHKDPEKEVVRAAEECAATLASYIPPAQITRILIPIIQTAPMPINLAAIKMQTRVMEQLSQDQLLPLLPDALPGLLKGYDDSESSVRKASVFCLVAMYMVVGEGLRPFLSELNGSKIKLLNLYIKRAQAQRESGKVTSPYLSDTS
ncbi:CLAP2-like protein [Mya arenaria]|uniref:CLAP2-like protein n=1 Tax=Mya arenaria TaxID=6604 RepID=A0ABY7E9Q6_MYAAR|nr:CLAP2-like protein [Mya arenaria]